MAEDKGDVSVDQSSEQRRYPRIDGKHRLFLIHEGERYQAETVDLSKAGMLAGCQVIPTELSKGAEALFELVWSADPSANSFIKGTIVRVIRDSDYDNVLLGVEFKEAMAQNPEALRGFLREVLGIEHGAVRVVKDEKGRKSLVFDFNPVHREGEERLRALQSNLFTSIDDLDEADRLLEGFGTGEHLFLKESLDAAGKDADRQGELPTVEDQAETLVAKKGTDNTPATAVEVPAEPAQAQTAPVPGEPKKKKTTAKTKKPKKKTTAKTKKPKKKTTTKTKKPKKVESIRKEKKHRMPGSKPSFFASLIPSFAKGERGGKLIEPAKANLNVANIDGIDIIFNIDGTDRPARAVRLYCAGIKCEVQKGLPELYRSVTLRIPGMLGKKAVVLNGDITRVRPDGSVEDKGIFEVRLSLRNETVMLNTYRSLVEKLSIGEK